MPTKKKTLWPVDDNIEVEITPDNQHFVTITNHQEGNVLSIPGKQVMKLIAALAAAEKALPVCKHTYWELPDTQFQLDKTPIAVCNECGIERQMTFTDE